MEICNNINNFVSTKGFMSHDALSVVCELQGKANVFSKKRMCQLITTNPCRRWKVIFLGSNLKGARKTDGLGLYGQVNKRIRWMPRQSEATKDVVACEKLRGACKLALIRRCPNGETRLALASHPVLNT